MYGKLSLKKDLRKLPTYIIISYINYKFFEYRLEIIKHDIKNELKAFKL